jgi:hypothetical protein
MRSTLVFVANPASGTFFNSPRPYLTVPAAILFVLGLAISFQQIRKRSHTILLAWFWSIVFLGGVMTLNPPANTRLVMTGPAVALLFALGLWQLIEVLRTISVPVQIRNTVAGLVLLVLTFENGYFYLFTYPSNHYFADRNAEVGIHDALQVAELGHDYALYLLGAPHVFVEFPLTAFLAPDNIRQDLTADSLSQVTIPAGQGALFVAIPENAELLPQVEEVFPGGMHSTLMRPSTPEEILYHSYTLEPAASNRP